MVIPPNQPPTPRPQNPSQAPQDPQSDPENKTGARPGPDELAHEAQLQRDGSAGRSAATNANTPRPTEPEKNTTRDPDLEKSTP
jgi:hypothetical protein